MEPQEYRTIVIGIQGHKPPCVQCDDHNVSFCMKTGIECQEFSDYTSVPTTKKMQNPVSGTFRRTRLEEYLSVRMP